MSSRLRFGETGGSGVNPVDLVDRVDREAGDTGGLQRNLNCALLMFNALMRWTSVDGGTPSFDAAPDEPPTRPRHSASMASTVSRSLQGAPWQVATAAARSHGRTDGFGSHDSSMANTSLELR